MRKYLITLLFFLTSLYPQGIQYIFDSYHETLCNVLVETSNTIDDYFVKEDNQTLSSTTHAEFSTSFAKESQLSLEKDVRFRLRLNLPKIQKNLRLFFEDENSNNLLYDGSSLTNEKLKNKQYYVGIEYFNYIRKSLRVRMGGGLRFRKGKLVPYFNVRSKYSLSDDEEYKAQLFDRLRYYTDGELENNFEFNTFLSLDENQYMIWNNNLYYSDRDKFETLYDEVRFISILNEKQQMSLGLGVRSKIDDFKSLKVDYYSLHSSFFHLFYKNWVYYELSPAILKRDSNNFAISYRFLINFGIYFNNK